MNLEMEIPKILWLKRHLPQDTFGRCKFYDLPDYLTYRATGDEARSFCSMVCKLAYVPEGADTSVFEIGWQRDLLRKIGLQEIADDLSPFGGIDGEPRLLRAGDKVGYLNEQSAKELGLHSKVAVGSGVIDGYSGWIGTAASKVQPHNKFGEASTRLATVSGTSTCHLVMSKHPVFTPGYFFRVEG
jgi:D-ribulokinase